MVGPAPLNPRTLSSSHSPPFAVAFAVDEELHGFGVGDAGDDEVAGAGAGGFADDASVVEEGGGEAAFVDADVLDVDEVGGADFEIEGVALDAVDDALVGDDPDVVVVAVPVEDEADDPVEEPEGDEGPPEDAEVVSDADLVEGPPGDREGDDGERDEERGGGPEEPPVAAAHVDDGFVVLEGEGEFDGSDWSWRCGGWLGGHGWASRSVAGG